MSGATTRQPRHDASQVRVDDGRRRGAVAVEASTAQDHEEGRGAGLDVRVRAVGVDPRQGQHALVVVDEMSGSARMGGALPGYCLF